MHKRIILISYLPSIFIIGFSGAFLILKNIDKVEAEKNILSAQVFQFFNSAELKNNGSGYLDVEKNISQKTTGLLMFRGNQARTFYGTGPLGDNLKIEWRYPERVMCADSTVGNETKQWCGSGWTGQPAVWERSDGITEVIFGAYDRKIHFLNADTGKEIRPSFETGDIIKGSVTVDPDGYPLLYSGSRDNKYRIIALDRDLPTELWNTEARKSDGVWNDDWDGNGVIIDGILYEGSENGIFHVIELNRSYRADGRVTISPKELFRIPTFSEDLIGTLGDDNLSIENSPVVYKDRVYIANSGGRIMGFDISNVRKNSLPVVFDFWAGDDIDATLLVDDEGKLYVASEEERLNDRSKEVGQLMKLDPKNEENPLVWSLHLPAKGQNLGGIWATPALQGNILYAVTNPGDLLTVDKNSGKILSKNYIFPHLWSSPVVIDDSLLVGTCQGELRKYSLASDRQPTIQSITKIPTGSCIESTPAVWNGEIFFGARDGFFYKIK